MNENNLVGFPLGTLNKIEIPRFINGFVKSMTASLAKFMVMAPTATSAVPSISSGSVIKTFRTEKSTYLQPYFTNL